MEKKIGLVLSGGGAKGAYEVGVWKALDRLGILPYIDGIYGTSVGALNAVLFDTCGTERAEEIWRGLRKRDFFHPGLRKQYDGTPGTLQAQLLELIIRVAIEYALSPEKRFDLRRLPYTLTPDLLTPTVDKIVQYIAQNGLPFNQEGILALINNNVSFAAQTRQIVVFCKQSQSPHSIVPFELKRFEDKVKPSILLASSAIPFFYQGSHGIQIGGKGYYDGGAGRQNANTPDREMRADGWEKIITVWLDPRPQRDRDRTDSDTAVHIVPSSNEIGRFFDGTVRVNAEKIKSDIALGYYDTIAKSDQLQRLIVNM